MKAITHYTIFHIRQIEDKALPDLITELKHDHAKITDTFKKVIELGINSEAGKKLLFSAKAHLLAHLKKEDVKLYPALWKEAQNNGELKNTLNAYALEMDEISETALAFFDKYASGGDALEFSKDYKQLYRVLNRRIINEESVIYKKYEELLF